MLIFLPFTLKHHLTFMNLAHCISLVTACDVPRTVRTLSAIKHLQCAVGFYNRD